MILKTKQKTKQAKQEEVFKSSNMDAAKVPETYQGGIQEYFKSKGQRIFKINGRRSPEIQEL